jgi:ABC-type uncharacterized transport system auxiliary subunit
MNALRRRTAWAACCAAALLAGCVTVDVGNSDGGVPAQFRLYDLAAAPARAPRTVPRSLLVAAVPSIGIGDSFSMAYSRAPHERALYQYASWAERPSNRVAQLLVRRLDARGDFASVAELGSGVNGDLVLNIAVDELVHDTASGQGRFQLTAVLVDRSARVLVARRTFESAVPVPQANARGAVEALSRAVTNVLDELVPWLDAVAEKLPATASR